MESSFVHDARVDLWSFGVTMYMVLCGVGPFRGHGAQLVTNKLLGDIQFDIVVPSESAMALIRRLLQVNPDDRIGIRELLTHDWVSLPDEILRQNDLEVGRLIHVSY
jgi:calcium/calmodulin-dependent protein kinase I